MRLDSQSKGVGRGWAFRVLQRRILAFQEKAPCWVLGINTAGSSWLEQGGADRLFALFRVSILSRLCQ